METAAFSDRPAVALYGLPGVVKRWDARVLCTVSSAWYALSGGRQGAWRCSVV
nr:MAG TPA: hypothetical protein [Caudoviricetes sp.]